MKDNTKLKELAKQITSMCLTDYLQRGNQITGVEQYTHIYLNEYKIIYKILINEEIFNEKVDDLAKEIALVYFQHYLSLYPRSTQECINVFIEVYKSALSEIELPKIPKTTSVLPEYKPNASSVSSKRNVILPEYKPKESKNKEEAPLRKGLVKFRAMGISFGR